MALDQPPPSYDNCDGLFYSMMINGLNHARNCAMKKK